MAAEAVETLREYLGGLPSELKFDYDKEAGRQVFKVVNPATHEVVKQYPPEEFLAMIRRLKELDRNADKNGMLFDDRY
jgi:flagellar protein FlaG